MDSEDTYHLPITLNHLHLYAIVPAQVPASLIAFVLSSLGGFSWRAELRSKTSSAERARVEMAVKTGAVFGEGGEVGLGTATADSVVGCGPWRGEPGPGDVLGVWKRGEGCRERCTWLSRIGCRVLLLCSSCLLRERRRIVREV